MSKFTIYETRSDATVLVAMFGKHIINVHYTIVPARIPYIRFRFRRLHDYQGPLPSIGRVPFVEGEFQFAIEDAQKRIVEELSKMLRFCYSYEKGYMNFDNGVSVEVRSDWAIKKDTLRITLRNAAYLPVQMPRVIDVGYTPQRNGRREIFVRNVIYGMLHAFCNEYVWYTSDV